jgi:hypothetical protein
MSAAQYAEQNLGSDLLSMQVPSRYPEVLLEKQSVSKVGLQCLQLYWHDALNEDGWMAMP